METVLALSVLFFAIACVTFAYVVHELRHAVKILE